MSVHLIPLLVDFELRISQCWLNDLSLLNLFLSCYLPVNKLLFSLYLSHFFPLGSH